MDDKQKQQIISYLKERSKLIASVNF
ncbi:hypothetical protein ACTFIZ_011511 [Dictyostelium cf. discoideum]